MWLHLSFDTKKSMKFAEYADLLRRGISIVTVYAGGIYLREYFKQFLENSKKLAVISVQTQRYNKP
jgi:hypothetical protein